MRSDQAHKFLFLATVLNLDIWLAVLVDYLEGEVFDIVLRFNIGEFMTNETLDIIDTGEVITILIDRLVRRQRVGYSRIMWIRRCSVFCSIPNEVFGVREGNIRGSCPVALVIGDNLNSTILPDTDATAREEMSVRWNGISATDDLPVGGTQIDTDGSAGNHFRARFCGGGMADAVGGLPSATAACSGGSKKFPLICEEIG